MVDVKRVISDLELQIRWIENNEAHRFPGWLNVTVAMHDAAELLKKQEARVLTLDDLETYVGEVWMEWRDGELDLFAMNHGYGVNAMGVVIDRTPLNVGGYGKTWRCWNAEPTDAEREAAAWRKQN